MKRFILISSIIFIFAFNSTSFCQDCGIEEDCDTTIIEWGTDEYCSTIFQPAIEIFDGYTCITCLSNSYYSGNWTLSTNNSSNSIWSRSFRCYVTSGSSVRTLYVACCKIDTDCPFGYVLDEDGKCIIQTEPDPPAHPDNTECTNGGGTSYRFYRTKANYKEVPPETLIQIIISSFFGDNSCITYYKTSYWDICCDIETIPTADNLNSGYIPEGCYTIRTDMHLQYGDPQAIHTDSTTTPWFEYDPASELGLTSDMCPWVTGEHVDTDGDGIPNYLDPDIDGDGIENRYDPDVDGDGIPNGTDPDIDGDGVPNTIDLDMDGDFIHNHLDDDIDGDGLLNEEDPDADGDGIPNEEDDNPFGPVDEDGNGMPDNLENPDDINGDEDQEDYNSSDFAITEDFLVGDDFDQYMEPEEIEVDTSELEALKDNYGMTLYNLNCQLHVTGDLGVVGTLDQTINFCPWEQSLIAIGYILVAFSGLLCLFRIFS